MSNDERKMQGEDDPEHQTGKKMILDGLARINDPTITYFIGMIVDRVADLVEGRKNKGLDQTAEELRQRADRKAN